MAQEPYERAVNDVFAGLDKVEELLKGKDYLVGNTLTEADIRLWVTIVRHTFIFEVVISGLISLPLLRFVSTQSIMASSNAISAQFEAVTRLSTGLLPGSSSLSL